MASTNYNGFSRTINELRIVMVGKTGIGKSASGNTILGQDCFESKFSAKSVTADCSKGKAVVDGQQVAVIDTPGLFDTRYGQDKTAKDICQCFTYAAPGPHVFLVVIRLQRYTEEEKQTVQRIQEIFGPAADRYSMVLFTGGDLLEETTIEEFLSGSPELLELVARCNGQYHVFNNKVKDPSQATELLQKINKLVQKNGGSYYTHEMFQEAERAVEEEKQRILKEKEEQIQREKQQLERKLHEEFEKDRQKIQKQYQEERERKRKEREEESTREKQEMNGERWEKESEKKREKEDRERERERVERKSEKEDRERGRERVEREEMLSRITKLEEQFDRELADGISNLQSRFENEARDEAENSNPVYHLVKSGKAIVKGFIHLGKAIWNVFKVGAGSYKI